MRHTVLALAAVAALSITAPAHAATIVSENFESGLGVFTASGQAGINTGTGYNPCCGTFGSAANMANHFVAFGSGNLPSGMITAPISLVAGTLYTLDFDFRSLGAGAEFLYAIVNGTTYSFLAAANNNMDLPYVHAMVTFTASGPSTTLEFHSDGINNVDAIVDNVTLTGALAAVPEPGTWALMLLGFGGIGLAMRRRKVAALA